MDNISVSVVVAVYNREKFLDRCIDSLVFQTLENLEIILVDDFSEDNSWSVMQKWQDRFPDKIRIMKSTAKGVAHAKNTGIQAARGEYIAFVDSDDWMDYKSFRWLYDVVEESHPLMVFSPLWKIKEGRRWKAGMLPAGRPLRTEDFLESSEPGYLVGKLIHRSLFEKHGLLPAFKRGEDLAWLYTVYSYTDSIVYIDKPGYYYEQHNDSVCANVTDPTIAEDIFASSEHMIQTINPQYRDWAIAYALNRAQNMKNRYALYYDRFEAYIQKCLALVEDRTEEDMPAVLARAVSRCNRVIPEQMPQRIYLNGFSDNLLLPDLQELKGVFGDDSGDICILNESNCDVSCVPVVAEAYRNGDIDFVGKYFAVKACYEQGGIYIDRDLEVDYPFNMLLHDPAFFGYESDDTFTDKVFGCCAGNACFGMILKTYELADLYDDPAAPLRERIKTILVGMGNVQMISGGLREPEYGFCLYPVDMFVYTLPCAENVHVCHYKPQALAQGECVTVPVSVLKSLLERQIRTAVAGANSETRKQQRRYEQEKRRSNKRSAYIAKMEEQREYMENSASWKITKPLRMIKKILGKG